MTQDPPQHAPAAPHSPGVTAPSDPGTPDSPGTTAPSDPGTPETAHRRTSPGPPAAPDSAPVGRSGAGTGAQPLAHPDAGHHPEPPSSQDTDYRRSLLRSRESRTRADRPGRFRLAGRDWTLLDDVFAPVYSPSTEVFLELLDFPPGGSVLEIGCGTGVIAVSAALAGCTRVVATDINPHAVRNAELNAARHGVAERVRCHTGDLFAPLAPEDRFDLVFWHSNFVLAPDGLERLDAHDLAYVDPGYRAHRDYLSQAPHRVRPGGTALLGFSSRGDAARLHHLAAAVGVTVEQIAHRAIPERGTTVDYRLLRIDPAPPGPAPAP
ncbi:methyltransferase domain-containing protein [Streptomyces sp. SAJ15]|uniref:methyltransferase domain-containing protein n=1 Tax=Streptomyces sp. SAJ15 TaxID=2011095 RepID=UPI001185989A|nr:methyltransferase domain-containing protein [Streptomyces sp. SAJ15]TVL89630.1 methyltransferase [Streptomyces sp. SAJ15]